MNRIIIFIIAVMGISASSCNKSYRCECTDTQKNALENFDIKATKATDAESKCAEHNGVAGSNGLTNCHLK